MNGNPTAAQKRLHKWTREQGCIVNSSENPALHHIAGAKANLKGVAGFGEWYVIPVCYWWHQDGNNENAIHVNKKRFSKTLGMTEKDYWLEHMQNYRRQFGFYPMSDSEYQTMADRA